MKKSHKILCSIIYLLVFLLNGFLFSSACFSESITTKEGIVLYVSTSGHDDNSGTEQAPFATVTRARDEIRKIKSRYIDEDITVLIRGGTYMFKEALVFGVEDSGNDNQNIIYAAYPGEKPVFSSGVEVTGWKKVTNKLTGLPEKAHGHIWEAPVPQALNRFYTLYDGAKRLPRARSEGFTPTKLYDFSNEGFPARQGYIWPPRNELHFPQGTLKNWSNLEDVEIIIRPHNVWTINILPLESVDEKSLVAKTKFPGQYPLGKLRNQPEQKSCWVENVLEFLDRPGEWVLNSKKRKIYLWPIDEQPSNNIRIPFLSELIRLEGEIRDKEQEDIPVRNLVFSGLTFIHAKRSGKSTLMCLRGSENCTVEACVFTASGGGGLLMELHCRKNNISNNHFYNLGSGAITLRGYGPGTKDVNSKNQIINNWIHHCSRIYWNQVGIRVWQSSENRIAHNLIHNLPYNAMSISGVRPHHFIEPWVTMLGTKKIIRWNEVGDATQWEHIIPFLHCRLNIIEYNEIHHVMEMLGDGNGISISGTGPFNVIRRNYFHHIDNVVGTIRTDGWQRDTEIRENVIYKCGGGIQRKHYNHVENNMLIDIKESGRYISFVNFPAQARRTIGSRLQRNIFYHTGKDPKFYLLRGWAKGVVTRPKDCDADFNLFYCKGNSQLVRDFIEEMRRDSIEMHSINADPLFVDLKSVDFRLKPDSPALKMGFRQLDVNQMGLTKDFPEHLKNKVAAEDYGEL